MFALISIVAILVTPCRGATKADSAKEPSPGAVDEMTSILNQTSAEISDAEKKYSDKIDTVDKSYEKSLSKANESRAQKVDRAKSAAVVNLKKLSARLASEGKLAEMVKVLKAVYSIQPKDKEVIQALKAAGVDIKTIPLGFDPLSRRGLKTSRIVIWNTHNGRYNTSGTLECNIMLQRSGKTIWRALKVSVPWERNKDTFAAVIAPTREFDTVRVEVTKWRGYSGGLSEVQIWQDGVNIAPGGEASASSSSGVRTTSAHVNDGITTSTDYKNGYWLLPDNRPGWVEIRLTRPEYQKLLRVKLSARTPWRRVLNVQAGDVIDVTAAGKWRASADIVAGPDGGLIPGGDQWGKYRDQFYLQGKFNSKVFRVGSRFTLQATESGVFELGMNEPKLGWFKNNSGFLSVTLSVRKRKSILKSDPDKSPKSTGVSSLNRNLR
ncbi:MAG: hypothetical protein GY794_06845 [bacterium]|nr:hypothetical protein [bacterium]